MVGAADKIIIALRDIDIDQLINVPFIEAFNFMDRITDNLMRFKIFTTDKLTVL